MFAAIVIRDDKALENIAKISRKRMKVGLQNMNDIASDKRTRALRILCNVFHD